MAADSMESNFVSMKPAVEFLDIYDQYSYNEDLECSFKFNDYIPQEGDRVAIFKLGWSLVKDYVVFEWAPMASKQTQHSVVFNKHILPKNNTEIYQICYISGENVLHGASSPFQFCANVSSMAQSALCLNTSENNPNKVQDISIEGDLKKLQEENMMLRVSLKAVIAQKTGIGSRNYDADIKELRSITDNLKASLVTQQKEINMLKSKIVEGGEEYKKLFMEKLKIERKYDKLKGAIEEGGKPVPNIVNFDIGDLKSIPPFPFAK